MNVTNSIRENKEQILAGIRKAFHEGADFLVTPEGSLSGYTSNFNQSEVASALEEINVAQENEKINTQSGLIDSNGERSLRVPDSGSQFFTARIQNLARWQ
jgi:predicted amidohydrolase